MAVGGSPSRAASGTPRARGRQPSGRKRKTSSRRLDARVGEAQGGGPLPLDRDRLGDAGERGFSNRAVVADSLDVQETSVGLKADLPQGGEVRQPLADLEVPRVVDRRLRPERAPLLVVLLD